MVRKKSEFRTPKVAAKALGAPDDAARFQIEQSPVAFRLDGSAANEHDGANGVVVLFLFEGGTETFHTGITVEEERAAVIRDGVPVGVDEDRGRGQLGQKFPHDGFHSWSKYELDPLFQKGIDGPYALCHTAQGFPVLGKCAQK